MSDLFQAAKEASKRTHSPYSRYPVGAAVRAASGRVYAGANMENASFPEGWCAETTALAHMVQAGDKELDEVCVYAARAARATPCGGCRQRLSEFGSAATKVHLCDADGIVETITLGDLLPSAFDL